MEITFPYDDNDTTYVPYTGAISDVNLGTHTLTTPIVYGDTASAGTLTLSSTSNATKGKILFGTSAYDEVNNRLGIGLNNPAYTLDVTGTGHITGIVNVDSYIKYNGTVLMRDNQDNSFMTQSASGVISNRTFTVGNATYSNSLFTFKGLGFGQAISTGDLTSNWFAIMGDTSSGTIGLDVKIKGQAGNAVGNNNGGNIVIDAGAKANSGTDGNIIIGATTGNVLIGATSIANNNAKFNISGSAATNAYGAAMLLNETANALSRNWVIGNGSGPNYGDLAFHVSAAQNGTVSNTPVMVLTKAGYLGVGTSTPGSYGEVRANTALTNAPSNVFILNHRTTGTAAIGFGVGNTYAIQSDTTYDRTAAQTIVSWVDATDATRRASKIDYLVNASGSNKVGISQVLQSDQATVYVGIGTSTPTQTLDVSGNINLSSGSVIKMNSLTSIITDTTNDNYFVGSAGNTSMSGQQNVGMGRYALVSNSSGTYNVAIGYQSLLDNTTGYRNMAMGYTALQQNTIGYYNTGVGFQTLLNSISGVQNTAIGSLTLYELGTPQTAGSFIVGINYTIKTVGTTNFTLIGASSNTIGVTFAATGAGTGTGTAYPSGQNNTAIGYNTARGIIHGVNNTIIGAQVSGLAAGLTNNIILATGAGAIKAQYDGTNWSLTGKLGVGTGSTVSANIHSLSTTEQLRLGYDATNYASFTTSSTGDLTIAPSGTSITVSKPIKLQSYTVATLPSGSVGMTAYVTDATAPTYLGTLTGGGTIVTPVFYNGTAWVSY